MSYLNTLFKFSAGGKLFDLRKQEKQQEYRYNTRRGKYEVRLGTYTWEIAKDLNAAKKAVDAQNSANKLVALKQLLQIPLTDPVANSLANHQSVFPVNIGGKTRYFTELQLMDNGFTLTPNGYTKTINGVNVKTSAPITSKVEDNKTFKPDDISILDSDTKNTLAPKVSVGKPRLFANGFSASNFEGADFSDNDKIRAFLQYAASKGFDFKNSMRRNGTFDGIGGQEVAEAWKLFGKNYINLGLETNEREDWLNAQQSNLNNLQSQLGELPMDGSDLRLHTAPLKRIGGFRNYGDNGELVTDLSEAGGTNYYAHNLAAGKRKDRVNAYKEAMGNDGIFVYTDAYGNTYRKDISGLSRRSFRHMLDSIDGYSVGVNDAHLSASLLANRNKVSSSSGITVGNNRGNILSKNLEADLQQARELLYKIDALKNIIDLGYDKTIESYRAPLNFNVGSNLTFGKPNPLLALPNTVTFQGPNRSITLPGGNAMANMNQTVQNNNNFLEDMKKKNSYLKKGGNVITFKKSYIKIK